MILERLNNKINPKKNICKLTQKLKTDKIALQNWKHGGGGQKKGETGPSQSEQEGRGLVFLKLVIQCRMIYPWEAFSFLKANQGGVDAIEQREGRELEMEEGKNAVCIVLEKQ